MLNYHRHKTILNDDCVSGHHTEKLTYLRIEITARKQQRFVQMEISIVLGKNEGYIPSSLGGRLISVGRQAGRQAVKQKFSRFDNFNSVSSKA